MLEKLLQSSSKIKNYDELTLSQTLNSGDYIISADSFQDIPRKKFLFWEYGGHVTYAAKYVYKVAGNLLYIYVLKDSTKNQIILSLAAVSPMDRKTFSIFYKTYISKQDVIFRSGNELLDNAKKMACDPDGGDSIAWKNEFDIMIRTEMAKNKKQVLFLETPPAKK